MGVGTVGEVASTGGIPKNTKHTQTRYFRSLNLVGQDILLRILMNGFQNTLCIAAIGFSPFALTSL